MSAAATPAFRGVPRDFGQMRTRIVPALQTRIAVDVAAKEQAASELTERRRLRAAQEATRESLDQSSRLASVPIVAGESDVDLMPAAETASEEEVRTKGAVAWGATKAVLGSAALYVGGLALVIFPTALVLGALTAAGRTTVKYDDLNFPALVVGNLVVLLFLVLRGRRAGLSLHDLLAPPADWRLAGRLLLGWGLGAAIALALIALIVVLVPHLMDGGPTSIGGLARLQGVAWIGAALATVVIAPLVEELLFRGHLQRNLGDAGLGRIAIVTIATLLFALAHWGVPLVGLVLIFGIGWAAGMMRERTGSVLPGMILHFGWNLGILLLSTLAAATGKV